MKLHINLTPEDYKKHWPEMMMRVREAMDAYLHEANGIAVEKNNYFTSKVFYPIYTPIAKLSESMLTFTFDNTDIKDKRIESNIEIITLDTRLDSVMDEVRLGVMSVIAELIEEVSDGEFKEGTVAHWLQNLTEADRKELRENIVRIVHSHSSELLDVLFRRVTSELLEITFRLHPRPVVVEKDGERSMSMSALLKDAEK